MSPEVSKYKVIIPDKVRKQVSKLPREYQRAVYLTLKSLEENPYQGKKLEDQLEDEYSLRVGVYRILYQIFKKQLVVLVVSVAHRKDVYRRR